MMILCYFYKIIAKTGGIFPHSMKAHCPNSDMGFSLQNIRFAQLTKQFFVGNCIKCPETHNKLV